MAATRISHGIKVGFKKNFEVKAKLDGIFLCNSKEIQITNCQLGLHLEKSHPGVFMQGRLKIQNYKLYIPLQA
jgi:hypothetical protein